jgi:hypothetical protein
VTVLPDAPNEPAPAHPERAKHSSDAIAINERIQCFT